MKKLVMIIALLLPLISMAQESTARLGSINYLDTKKSYKVIKLGGDIKDLKSEYLFKLSETPDASGCYVYTYNDPALLNFGNGVVLKRLQIKTYVGLVSSIYLFFEKEDGNRVRDVFTTAYGSNYTQSNAEEDSYLWKGSLATLYLTYEKELSAAMYTSVAMDKIISQRKANSASSAASDL